MSSNNNGICPRCRTKRIGNAKCSCFTLHPRVPAYTEKLGGRLPMVSIEKHELYLHTVLVEQMEKYDQEPTLDNGRAVLAAFHDIKEFKS